MRIRRKKHLEERVFNVGNLLLTADFDKPNVKEAVSDKKYFDFSKIFNNSNPVELEIGCGKGGFIIEKAKRNQNVNFLAVELIQNIIIMGVEKAKEEKLENLIFFNSGADYLPRYIKPASIQNIYLNFSPPFPGKRYENRRLTNPKLIENYKEFLVNEGKIFQKTDDKDFFEYSKQVFSDLDFEVLDVTEKYELTTDNIETEYEKKFKENGQKIYCLIAVKKE